MSHNPVVININNSSITIEISDKTLSSSECIVNADGLWHTALDDASNTGKILVKLIELGWSPEAYFDAKAEAAEAARIEKEIRRARWLERKNQQYVE